MSTAFPLDLVLDCSKTTKNLFNQARIQVFFLLRHNLNENSGCYHFYASMGVMFTPVVYCHIHACMTIHGRYTEASGPVPANFLDSSYHESKIVIMNILSHFFCIPIFLSQIKI